MYVCLAKLNRENQKTVMGCPSRTGSHEHAESIQQLPGSMIIGRVLVEIDRRMFCVLDIDVRPTKGVD